MGSFMVVFWGGVLTGGVFGRWVFAGGDAAFFFTFKGCDLIGLACLSTWMRLGGRPRLWEAAGDGEVAIERVSLCTESNEKVSVSRTRATQQNQKVMSLCLFGDGDI
jgi:hypothetical protein